MWVIILDKVFVFCCVALLFSLSPIHFSNFFIPPMQVIIKTELSHYHSLSKMHDTHEESVFLLTKYHNIVKFHQLNNIVLVFHGYPLDLQPLDATTPTIQRRGQNKNSNFSAMTFQSLLPSTTLFSLHQSVENLKWQHSSLAHKERIPLKPAVAQDKLINSEE